LSIARIVLYGCVALVQLAFIAVWLRVVRRHKLAMRPWCC
jgi:hypothetical protein